MVVRSGVKIQSRIASRRHAECASICASCSNSRRSPFAVFLLSSEAEASRRSSNLPSASSSRPSPRRDADPASHQPIEASGCCCRGTGRDGRTSSSSSSRTPWPDGIAEDSGSTGARSRSPALVGLRFRPRCEHSFNDSPTRTAGAPGRFKRSSRSSGSSLGFPRSLDISQNENPTAINADDGAGSFGITDTTSRRWTFSSCPRRDFGCSMPGP